MRFIIAILMMFPVAASAQENCSNFHVTRILDGDTFAGFNQTPLGRNLWEFTSIRVNNIDTPEKGFRGKCLAEKLAGKKATEFAKTLIPLGAGKICITNPHNGKYAGRLVADVWIKKRGKLINYADLMIAKGHAKEYHGKKKPGWCG